MKLVMVAVLTTCAVLAADHGPVFGYATPVNSEREFSFDTGLFLREDSEGAQLSSGTGIG